MFLHVSEGERSVVCQEAAGNQEGFYGLFSVIFVSLTSSGLPKGAAATSLGPRKAWMWGAVCSH